MPDPDLHCIFDSEDEGEEGDYDSDDEDMDWNMPAMMLMQSMY